MVVALTLVSTLVLTLTLALAPAAEAGGPFMMVGAADDVVLNENAAEAATQVGKAQQAGLDTLRLTAQWSRGQTALPSRTAGALETARIRLASIWSPRTPRCTRAGSSGTRT